MHQRAAFAAYAAGLQNWRAGAFSEAADLFAAAGDKPGSLFALRARRMADAPLPATWDGVNVLDEK
jgi:hypothetical protein